LPSSTEPAHLRLSPRAQAGGRRRRPLAQPASPRPRTPAAAPRAPHAPQRPPTMTATGSAEGLESVDAHVYGTGPPRAQQERWPQAAQGAVAGPAGRLERRGRAPARAPAPAAAAAPTPVGVRGEPPAPIVQRACSERCSVAAAAARSEVGAARGGLLQRRSEALQRGVDAERLGRVRQSAMRTSSCRRWTMGGGRGGYCCYSALPATLRRAAPLE